MSTCYWPVRRLRQKTCVPVDAAVLAQQLPRGGLHESQLRRAASRGAAALGQGWRCAYLGQPFRLPPPRHRETHYHAQVRHWDVPPGTQVAHQTVAFRWTPSGGTPVLVHQRADNAVARGARPPPGTDRRLARLSAPGLRRLAREASNLRRPRRGEEGFGQGCTCEYLGQPQGRGRSLRYVEDPAAWRVPPGGRRSHTKLALRWHIRPAETIVHLSLHNVLARGVRAPDHWAAGLRAARAVRRRPAAAVEPPMDRGRGGPQLMRRPAGVAVMTPEGAGQPVTRRGRSRPEWMRRPAAARVRDQELLGSCTLFSSH